MTIISEIFVWTITVFGACLGIIVGGIIGWIIGGLISLITKLKCTFVAFNVAMGMAILGALICVYLSHQQIEPLNCDDNLEGLMVCFTPSLIPFWGAVVGGFFGAWVGVFVQVFIELKRKIS